MGILGFYVLIPVAPCKYPGKHTMGNDGGNGGGLPPSEHWKTQPPQKVPFIDPLLKHKLILTYKKFFLGKMQ